MAETRSPDPTDPPEQHARQRRQGDPDRVVAFTDGVFAIIITILVLEIGVPSNLSEQSLREALDETGATLLAWVISFLLVGMYWVWHRDLFVQVREVNRDLVWLNLIFLLPVSLIPFAAAMLGEYHDEPIALHLYGVVLIAASLVRVGMYQYVSKRPALLWEPTTARARRVGLSISAAPIALYVLAMLLAGLAPLVSLVVYFGVPAAYFVLITVLRDRPATAGDADGFS
jgi:uncharacterized membrane protein